MSAPLPPQPTTDSARMALVEALIATGSEDRAAFATLYKLTNAKLFGICLRICGDRGAAEDVLSDVYLTVWRRAGAYEPGRASPISWLATIARNRAIDWRRSASRRPSVTIDKTPDVADDAPSAEDRMVAGEAAGRLHLCLDQLDDKQRGAIRSAFFGGLTYAELAERDAVPLGTMKSWVRRGLQRLKDCLSDD